MRIGFNATLISAENANYGYRRSGIARYLEQLLAALPTALGGDELVVYTGLDVSPPPIANTLHWHNARIALQKPAVRIAWEHAVLPIATRRDHVDLFHGTMNVIPRGLPCPSVVTIHDLAFLRWPQQVPERRYRYLSSGVRDAVNRATRIIAVSEATKADTVELLGVDPARISVTPLAVDSSFTPSDSVSIQSLLQRQRINRPFILAVGNLEPRKNLPTLLRAFARLATDVPHDLVIVGGEGWLTETIYETLNETNLRDRVRMTGFVADADLPTWFSAADLFVFPSFYEGFGLPILEAMACGTPVVTANTSAMPEVAGDAALLIDPRDDEAMAVAITRLLTDPLLADNLRQRGRARAATFTWDKTAAATVAVYRRAREEAK